MLVHSQLQPFHSTRGAYGYSQDGLSWTLLPDYSWETNMTWTDGSVSYFVRRQAPGLFLDHVFMFSLHGVWSFYIILLLFAVVI